MNRDKSLYRERLLLIMSEEEVDELLAKVSFADDQLVKKARREDSGFLMLGQVIT